VTKREVTQASGYGTLCRRLPGARIVDGPDGWGKVILLDDGGRNPPSWWYDPFQRLDIADFYGLMMPKPDAERQVLAAARSAGLPQFEAELTHAINVQLEEQRAHAPWPLPPLPLWFEMTPYAGGPRHPDVEEAVVRLLTPSRSCLAAIQGFVRAAGAIEDPLPLEYNPLLQAFGIPAYPVLRLAYLAHEMYYVLQLAWALKEGQDELTRATATLLSLLIRNRPWNPLTQIMRNERKCFTWRVKQRCEAVNS